MLLATRSPERPGARARELAGAAASVCRRWCSSACHMLAAGGSC
jgi:hypothetical protein